MKSCLSERRLVLAHLGDGRDAERAHLRDCATCAARAASLASDLSHLDRILLAPPPRVRRRAAWLPMRWLPATAVVAVAAVALMITTRVTRESPGVVANGESVTAFATEVSSAVFAADSNRDDAQTTDLDYLQAAVGGQVPCGSGTDFDARCDADYAEVAYWDD